MHLPFFLTCQFPKIEKTPKINFKNCDHTVVHDNITMTTTLWLLQVGRDAGESWVSSGMDPAWTGPRESPRHVFVAGWEGHRWKLSVQWPGSCQSKSWIGLKDPSIVSCGTLCCRLGGMQVKAECPGKWLISKTCLCKGSSALKTMVMPLVIRANEKKTTWNNTAPGAVAVGVPAIEKNGGGGGVGGPGNWKNTAPPVQWRWWWRYWSRQLKKHRHPKGCMQSFEPVSHKCKNGLQCMISTRRQTTSWTSVQVDFRTFHTNEKKDYSAWLVHMHELLDKLSNDGVWERRNCTAKNLHHCARRF